MAAELTKHEVAAMWLYGEDYSLSGMSAKTFWSGLAPNRKKLVDEMVRAILKAPITDSQYRWPKGIGA